LNKHFLRRIFRFLGIPQDRVCRMEHVLAVMVHQFPKGFLLTLQDARD
jgi:hypothetical protein